MEEFRGEIPLGKEEKELLRRGSKGSAGTLKLLTGTGVLEFTGTLMVAKRAPASASGQG